jgi:hypothetical protein
LVNLSHLFDPTLECAILGDGWSLDNHWLLNLRSLLKRHELLLLLELGLLLRVLLLRGENIPLTAAHFHHWMQRLRKLVIAPIVLLEQKRLQEHVVIVVVIVP